MQELSLLFSSMSWNALDDPDRDRDTQRTKLKTKKCDMSKNYHCALEKRQGSNCSNMDGRFTAKNATVLLQVVNRLVATSQQTCQFFQVATRLFKSGLPQLVIRRLVTTG